MKLGSLLLLAALVGAAQAQKGAVKLTSEGHPDVHASMEVSANGTVVLHASNCVNRLNWCGRYRRTDCAASSEPVVSEVKWVSAADPAQAAMLQLHADGVLAFACAGDAAAGGCVDPAASPLDASEVKARAGLLLKTGGVHAGVVSYPHAATEALRIHASAVHVDNERVRPYLLPDGPDGCVLWTFRKYAAPTGPFAVASIMDDGRGHCS